MPKLVKIIGAGVAGLASGITLARAGYPVEIWEHHPSAGYRFHDGFQILENYHSHEDALYWLEKCGFTTDFFRQPGKSIHFFNSRLKSYLLSSRTVFGYFVKRGSANDTLDSALARQAESLGVKFHWGTRLEIQEGDIIATGCRQASGVAREMAFETNLDDTYYTLLDNQYTPLGFSYLFVIGGTATIGAAALKDFARIEHYFDLVLERFQEIGAFSIRNPRFGNYKVGFFLPSTARKGSQLFVGEAAGFQDFLFGLGIRRSMLSGYAAARSIIDNIDYDELWKREFGGLLKASIVNRFFYEKFGNLGYRILLNSARKRDFRTLGYWLSQNTPVRRIFFPLITKFLWKKGGACRHGEECLWCRP